MKENKVITDIEGLTPEWMTNIFKNKGYLSQGKITKIIKKYTISTSNTLVHFLELSYSNGSRAQPASPEVVIRIPQTNRPSQQIGKHEAKFYSIVAKMMNEIVIPTCYDAAYSEKTGLSHIILNNLSTTHTEWIEERPGPLKLQYIEQTIDTLAEFHAFWWDHPKLKELSKHSFVFYTFKENSFNEKDIMSWFENENKSINRMLISLGDQLSDTRKDLFETVASKYPKTAYERLNQRNITLLHGDAHQWNYFFPKEVENEKSKAILCDWEFWGIGPGAQDLAFMLGYCWPHEPRRVLEKDLLKRYHTNLLNYGVKNYSWDDCWYDYRLSALLNVYKVVSKWGNEWLLSDWWATLEASCDTIQDLNCIEILKSR